MALNTDLSLRNSTIYSLYLRNHSPEGTLRAAQGDLARIRNLGTDILWLLPIHPIGEKNRKGSAGSPYAIRDYRGINPEYGTLEDFTGFVEEAHRLGMKVMIDVVYNHTSPDSLLFEQHPEWFYQKPGGGPGNRVGEWYDIIDLDFSNQDLQDYLIDTLEYWLSLGVDGFRCDVAPLLPLEFWMLARERCEARKPGVIWLSESVEPRFLLEMRNRGYGCLSDGEIYRAFDVAYDYDSFDVFKLYLEGRADFEDFIDVKRRQQYILPGNYLKLRFTENHDQERSRHWIPDPRAHRNWTAFTAFEQGTFLVYGGQEVADPHRPDLFDKDPVRWETEPGFAGFIQKLTKVRRDPIHCQGFYQIHRTSTRGVVVATYRNTAEDLSVSRLRLGIFTLEDKRGTLDLTEVLPQGLLNLEAKNLLDGEPVRLTQGKTSIPREPVILDLL
ncbi:alpha-amylase family glycosyl hydrolase [Spirochaeta lutea]|uniref:Alpha-amylase n=1 Tax=Spirochaeta lutea TaxID=1480694 RepID=A0A098QVL1_9SPIO|nr:alpha-amylase family glycosyl hydrolase [Spirochaeta lutea]KGE71621.1 alpha-amylase [Spirochaeta lutea]